MNMNRKRINQFYAIFGQHETGYRAGWVTTNCLLAPWTHGEGIDRHPSFAIKEDLGLSLCKCFSCGFGGELVDLLRKIQWLSKKNPLEGLDLTILAEAVAQELEEAVFDLEVIPDYDAKVASDEPFPEEWLATFLPATKFKEALGYLGGRQVSMQVIARMDIRYDPILRRVGFPFRNAKGDVMGVQGRAIDDVALRYFQYGYMGRRNAHVWLGEHQIDFDEPVVLVEGPFDAARVMEVYPNVLGSFTTGLSVQKINRLRDAPELVTLFDVGAGGNAARVKIRKLLGKKATIIDLVPSLHEKDPGNMTVERLDEILGEHLTLGS